MAVVDDNIEVKSGRGFPELKTIDINDSSLPDGAEVEMNLDADAWESACPPPDGTYKLKLFEARNAYQMGMTDDKEVYYVVNLECKIQSDNKDLQDRTVFAKVSTLVSQGKEISTVVGLIRKMGPNLPTKLTPKQQIQLFKRVLGKEPSLYATGEWAAWDMDKGAWIAREMKKFPKMENGKGYHHVVRDSKGNQVTAKWKVVKWLGIKEYKDMLEKEDARKKQQGSSGSSSKSNSGGASEAVGDFQEMKVAQPPQQQQQATTVKEEDFVIEE